MRRVPRRWKMGNVTSFGFSPIGLVHSPYRSLSQAPPQDGKEIAVIEVYREYSEGLKDLEHFSHINVFYWLHLSKGWDLLLNTPWDTQPHGVFSTRSPRRPVPIGFSVVELVGRRGNFLAVRGLDAVDGTPVLDIKPYIPSIDSVPHASSGWMNGKIPHDFSVEEDSSEA